MTKMTSFEYLSSDKKPRVALYSDVMTICNETCHHLGLDISKPAMIIIAELVYKKLSIYGSDLESFAEHAQRTLINTDDVSLLVRRNPSLKAHLSSKFQAVLKRRKTTSSINAPKKIKMNNNINLPSTSRDSVLPVVID